MNREFPFYLKSLDGASLYEIYEDKEIHINRTVKKNETTYTITTFITQYVESPFHTISEYQSTKEEFNSIKYEFLNWVDQTFNR